MTAIQHLDRRKTSWFLAVYTSRQECRERERRESREECSVGSSRHFPKHFIICPPVARWTRKSTRTKTRFLYANASSRNPQFAILIPIRAQSIYKPDSDSYVCIVYFWSLHSFTEKSEWKWPSRTGFPEYPSQWTKVKYILRVDRKEQRVWERERSLCQAPFVWSRKLGYMYATVCGCWPALIPSPYSLHLTCNSILLCDLRLAPVIGQRRWTTLQVSEQKLNQCNWLTEQ